MTMMSWISVVMPILVYLFTPQVIKWLSGRTAQRNILLVVACVVYFVSWYLPSPLIHGRDTSFTTHVVGGGIFSGLLWLYTKQQLKWKANKAVELTALIAMVSILGVANELLELALVEVGLSRLTLTDTNWDLVANTLGAMGYWVGYEIFILLGWKKK